MTKFTIKATSKNDAKFFIDDIEIPAVRKVSLEMVAGETPKAIMELYLKGDIDVFLPDSSVTIIDKGT